MNTTTYKVTCKQCNKSDDVGISDSLKQVKDWGMPKNIVSARFRLDGQWGFQCLCGNYDIITRQEDTFIKNKQNPAPQDIMKVINNLIPQAPKFKMEKI